MSKSKPELLSTAVSQADPSLLRVALTEADPRLLEVALTKAIPKWPQSGPYQPQSSSDAAPKSKSDIVIDDEDTEPSKPSQNLDNTGVVTPDNNNDCDKKLLAEQEKEPEIVKTLLPAAVAAESESM